MFTKGFEKTAGKKHILPSVAGTIAGKTKVAPAKIRETISEFVNPRKKTFHRSVEEAVRGPKPELGSNLAKIQERKVVKQQRKGDIADLKHNKEISGRSGYLSNKDKQDLAEASKESIKARHERLQKFKEDRSKGPSFAYRHPLITTGTGLLLGKSMFGEKSQQQQQPQFMPPQQY